MIRGVILAVTFVGGLKEETLFLLEVPVLKEDIVFIDI